MSLARGGDGVGAANGAGSIPLLTYPQVVLRQLDAAGLVRAGPLLGFTIGADGGACLFSRCLEFNIRWAPFLSFSRRL